MLYARVVGHAHSTVQHDSMRGVRLLLCEALDGAGEGTGKFCLAADWLGAGLGHLVMISTDGEAATRKTGRRDTPLRNCILGLIDEAEVPT
jgi:microcompartment protein CcmK/EutM